MLDFSATKASFTRAPELGDESNDIIVLQKILGNMIFWFNYEVCIGSVSVEI